MSERWGLARIHKMRDRIEYGAQSDDALNIIEAVVEDRYSHIPREDKGYIVLAIQTDKPCPTCGGEGYINKLTGKITEVGELAEGLKCATCGGSGEVPTDYFPRMKSRSKTMHECPDCRGKHFIPGKGRGM